MGTYCADQRINSIKEPDAIMVGDTATTNKITNNLAKIFLGYSAVYLILVISQFYWAGVGLLSESPDSSNHTATGNIIATLPVGFLLVAMYANGYKNVNPRSGAYEGANVVMWLVIMFSQLATVPYAIYIYKHIFEGGEQLSSLDPPGEVAIGSIGYVLMLLLPLMVIGFLIYKFKGNFPVPADWRLGALMFVPFILSHVQYMLIWPFQEGFIGDAEGMSSALHPLNGIIILLFAMELFRRAMPMALGEKYRFGFTTSDVGSGRFTRYLYYIPLALFVLLSIGEAIGSMETAIQGLS